MSIYSSKTLLNFKLVWVMTVSLVTLTGNSLDAQWTNNKAEKLCEAVEEENWKSVHHQVEQMIKHWTYLDTNLGYSNYSLAIDSMVRILDSLACSQSAYADFCAMKIAIWPGNSALAVAFPSSSGTQEFCYHIQEGKMRGVGIRGIFYLPLKSKEELVYLTQSSCPGFIEEQKRQCEEARVSKL